MRYRIAAILLIVLLLLAAASCGKKTDPGEPIDPSEPGTTVVKPTDDPGNIETKEDYLIVGYTDDSASFGYPSLMPGCLSWRYDNGALLAEALAFGDVDTAVIPTNLACRYYTESGGKISVLGLSLSGDVWLMESSEDDMLFADSIGPDMLLGRTVYIPYEGGAEDVMTRIAADYSGLVAGSAVLFEYLPYAELEEQVRSESGSFAAVPEPIQEGFELGFSTSWVWQISKGTDFCPMYCVAVNRERVSGEKLEALKELISVSGSFLTGESALIDSATPFLRACYRIDPLLIGGYMPDDGLYE